MSKTICGFKDCGKEAKHEIAVLCVEGLVEIHLCDEHYENFPVYMGLLKRMACAKARQGCS